MFVIINANDQSRTADLGIVTLPFAPQKLPNWFLSKTLLTEMQIDRLTHATNNLT